MLQHVPIAWENAHPIIEIADVDGAPDPLFRTFFGGHTAYAALVSCDKIGLAPDALFFRPRAAFEDATALRANLPIEGRRPGLDESSQAAIRFIMHERRRHAQFVQLYSVRRALIESGTVGPLWQQRQRLVTGKDPVPLQPPPAVEWNFSPRKRLAAAQQQQAEGGEKSDQKQKTSASLAPDQLQPQQSFDVVDDITAMIERQQTEQLSGGDQKKQQDDDASSVAVHMHSPPRPQHPPWPVVPEPAPLFRWRTKEVLEKEEQYLAETCQKLVQFGTAFIKAEQSRVREQILNEQQKQKEKALALQQQQRANNNQSRISSRGGNPSTLASPISRTSNRYDDDDDDDDDDEDGYSSPAGEGSPGKPLHPFRDSKILGLEHLQRPPTVGGRPTTADTLASAKSGDTMAALLESTVLSRGGKRRGAGGTSGATVNRTSTQLWQLGESPFSVAGVRPPRPPTTREALVTKFGKKIGDDYVSKTVRRHLRVIAKRAAEEIATTVHLNERDDEIREEMEVFMAGRKEKVTAPYMGKGFLDGETALNDSIFQDQNEKRKGRVDYEEEIKSEERLDKMRVRHERQEDRLAQIEDRKATSRALSKEAELVRRENISYNRARRDHVEHARRLVIQASRAGRHERVEMLREQHRAASWNSRVSHEMEAMIRSQVKDKVKAMQLTRRWELEELPAADELADIFHSGKVMKEWQSGMMKGLDSVQERMVYETDPSARRGALKQQMQSPYSKRRNDDQNSSTSGADAAKNLNMNDDSLQQQQQQQQSQGKRRSINNNNDNNNNDDGDDCDTQSENSSDEEDLKVKTPLQQSRAQQQQRRTSGSISYSAPAGAPAALTASAGFSGALPNIRPSTGDMAPQPPMVLHSNSARKVSNTSSMGSSGILPKVPLAGSRSGRL